MKTNSFIFDSKTLSLVLFAAFLSLGLLSGCSNTNQQVAEEIVANKRANAEEVARALGRIGNENRADRSLWSLGQKDSTN